MADSSQKYSAKTFKPFVKSAPSQSQLITVRHKSPDLSEIVTLHQHIKTYRTENFEIAVPDYKEGKKNYYSFETIGDVIDHIDNTAQIGFLKDKQPPYQQIRAGLVAAQSQVKDGLRQDEKVGLLVIQLREQLERHAEEIQEERKTSGIKLEVTATQPSRGCSIG